MTEKSNDYITYKPRNGCGHEEPQRIPLREAVQTINAPILELKAKLAKRISDGYVYYISTSGIVHHIDCPTVKRVISRGFQTVSGTDELESIRWRYEYLMDYGNDWLSYAFMPSWLSTREEVADCHAERCRTCAPDVNPQAIAPDPTGGKRPKAVVNLDARDLGRLLDGSPIESVAFSPDGVIVRTADAVHRFAGTESILLYGSPGTVKPRTRSFSA